MSKDKYQENWLAPTINLVMSESYYIKYKKEKYKLYFYDSGGSEQN